jgi:septal ring factor EnvC (AmiA/AmiB activator)
MTDDEFRQLVQRTLAAHDDRHAAHEARLTRADHDLETLRTIMIDLAETNSKVEDQLLRFIASQREINTRQDAINARLDATLAAIKELLQRPPNGH